MNFTGSLAIDTTTTTALPSVLTGVGSGGSLLKFREDGMREAPLFTAPTNMTIMVVGLGILIVPVICVFIAICARTKVFVRLRDLKFLNEGSDGEGDESKLPYSRMKKIKM
jgi:hypothetical protein